MKASAQTIEWRDSLYRGFVVALDASPGATYWGVLQGLVEKDGLTPAQIVSLIAGTPQFQSVYASGSDQAFGSALITRVLGSAPVSTEARLAALAAAEQILRDALQAGQSEPARRTTLINGVSDYLGAIKLDPSQPGFDASHPYLAVARQLANKVAVATYYTETLKGTVTLIPTLQAVVGRTTDKSDVSSPAALAGLALSREGGRIQDGYISGATVFADADGDGTLDPGEASASSGQDGSFNLAGALGSLVATGGVDTSTKLSHTTVLRAPSGSSIVNPLTTVISAVADTGVPLAQAQAQVAEKLGLPSTVTLTSFDPLQVASSATASAEQKAAAVSVYKASALVANVLTQTTAAVSGASTSVKSTDAASAAASSIAKLITTANRLLKNRGKDESPPVSRRLVGFNHAAFKHSC